MTVFQLEAEVRLIRWGESSSAGRTITLELPPDAGEGHPFKGFPTGHAHGQRFRIAFIAIADDETPIPACAPPRERPAADIASPRAGGGANSISAKERYAAMSPGEQAVQRAGILAGDPRFQAWAEDQLAPTSFGFGLSEEAAADFIRARCCSGGSRKRIAQEPEALDKYIALETAFKIAVGEIAEPR